MNRILILVFIQIIIPAFLHAQFKNIIKNKIQNKIDNVIPRSDTSDAKKQTPQGANGVSNTKENITSTPKETNNRNSGKHYIGEKYGGGIIYYIDETGEHGLISSLKDQNKAEYDTKWRDALELAHSYVDSEHHIDWRLPTADELVKLYVQRNIVGGFNSKVYWSSSASRDSQNALSVQFVNGNQNGSGTPKYVKMNVRAIRSF